MSDEISKHTFLTAPGSTDCSATFAEELQAGFRSIVFVNQCSKNQRITEMPVVAQAQEAGPNIVPFIALAAGHGEVEPVRIGPNGMIQELERPYAENLNRTGPQRVPEGIEAELHIGAILEF
jgi:hypothetical protein